ncbi:OLC1v1028158C1 [Oldenlandia corymbosa var. corymbosa]|uniref:OLC1v1028158C1 n=1 Tax=Oldenlandia corymbosa var. corymbosa TaxID=529605 RepID=A0AAV1CBC4_OLDCO|nr:OLC1v1028158C1 [Oldenlandia corymbosa var. corymbosa]
MISLGQLHDELEEAKNLEVRNHAVINQITQGINEIRQRTILEPSEDMRKETKMVREFILGFLVGDVQAVTCMGMLRGLGHNCHLPIERMSKLKKVGRDKWKRVEERCKENHRQESGSWRERK